MVKQNECPEKGIPVISQKQQEVLLGLHEVNLKDCELYPPVLVGTPAEEMPFITDW